MLLWSASGPCLHGQLSSNVRPHKSRGSSAPCESHHLLALGRRHRRNAALANNGKRSSKLGSRPARAHLGRFRSRRIHQEHARRQGRLERTVFGAKAEIWTRHSGHLPARRLSTLAGQQADFQRHSCQFRSNSLRRSVSSVLASMFAARAVRPNPSLEPGTSTGMALSPRSAQA